MGNYVFNTKFMYEQLIRDADDTESSHDFGSDLLPHMVEKYSVFAYPMGEGDGRTYWRDVGTLDAFWSANMELLDFSPELDLYDKNWPVYTHQMQLPPAKFIHDDEDRRGTAISCTVSGGCIISGANIKNSVLFSNVNARSYSSIDKSVILPDVTISRHCKIQRAIIDVGCEIPEGMEIGFDKEKDIAAGFRVTDSGITLVTPDQLGQLRHRIR